MAIVAHTEESDTLQTADVRLAAALLSLGIRPVGGNTGINLVFPNKPGVHRTITMEPVSMCGKYRTSVMLAAWKQGLSWIEANPEHKFAYCMACMMNHRDLVTSIKQEEEFAFIKKGKSVAMLSTNAPLRTEEEILGRW